MMAVADVEYATDPRARSFFATYPSRRLNLGSGADIRDGYTNIDMHDYQRSNSMVGDVTNLTDLPSGNFDEILALDIIEHIRFSDTSSVFYEWNRLLRPGGRLSITTTYLNGLIRLFEMKEYQSIGMQLKLLTNLFSRQLVPGDFHLTAFTEPLMRFYFWMTNFDIVTVSIKHGWIFDISAVKRQDPAPPELLAIPEDGAFVAAAFEAILGRPADASGLANFLAHLAGGVSRPDVVKQIWTSEESQARLIERSPVFDLKFHQST